MSEITPEPAAVESSLRRMARVAVRLFLGRDSGGRLPEISSLGHGESAAFRVDGSYLLRLHLPSRSSADASFWTRAALESELDWLDAIAYDTNLVVQRPVSAPAGQRIVEVDDAQGVARPCTLLTWVEGEQREEQPTREQSRRCGRLVAELHEHASAWKRPDAFERPVHEPARVLPALDSFEAAGIAEKEDITTLYRAAKQLLTEVGELPRTSEYWGLIHADLHDGNTLFLGDEPRPIDFGTCGFGYWMYDIAESLLHRFPEGREALVQGYAERRALPDGHLRAIEAFFLVGAITGFAHQTERGDDRDRLARTSAYVTERFARPFLAQEAFLF